MASLKEYQSLSAAPSVSGEQWKKHALKKMSSGYMLIISDVRDFARFYKGNGQLETCSFRTARRLLKGGFIEPVGEHEMGTLYQLSEQHRDAEALTQVRKSKLGAVPIEEELVDPDAADFDESLSDEAIANDGDDEDFSVVDA